MYQVIIGIVIVLSAGFLITAANNAGLAIPLIFSRITGQWKKSANRLSEIKNKKSPIFPIFSDFILFMTTVFFLILAFTGFIPVLILGNHLSGVLLIIHVTTAPLFVVSLMLTLVLRANKNQFTTQDYRYFISQWNQGKDMINSAETSAVHQKISFWLFSVFALPAILSMVLSMYPIFGTGWQVSMLNLHQFSVLILFIVSMFYLKARYLSASV